MVFHSGFELARNFTEKIALFATNLVTFAVNAAVFTKKIIGVAIATASLMRTTATRKRTARRDIANRSAVTDGLITATCNISIIIRKRVHRIGRISYKKCNSLTQAYGTFDIDWIYDRQNRFLAVNLIVGLLISTAVVGFACVQHCILRLILYRTGSIPWNYARFLNYATERMFLQRIGGRRAFHPQTLARPLCPDGRVKTL